MKKVLLGLVVAVMMTGSGYSIDYTDTVDVNIDTFQTLKDIEYFERKEVSNRSEQNQTSQSYSRYGSASQCNLLETLMSLHYENMNFYSYKFLKHSGNDSKFRTKYMQYAEEYIQHVNLLKDTSDIYNNICN